MFGLETTARFTHLSTSAAVLRLEITSRLMLTSPFGNPRSLATTSFFKTEQRLAPMGMDTPNKTTAPITKSYSPASSFSKMTSKSAPTPRSTVPQSAKREYAAAQKSTTSCKSVTPLTSAKIRYFVHKWAWQEVRKSDGA